MKTMSSQNVPNPNQNRILEPFDNIGLCFSGGGFRATFYALGVLSYLNRIEFRQKPLLESVTALSTVSGGTITGVGYALAHAKYMEIHEGQQHIPRKCFNEFFSKFCKQFNPSPQQIEQSHAQAVPSLRLSSQVQALNPLNKNRLLDRVLQILEDKKVWEQHSHKKKSLINAFAIAYGQMKIFKSRGGRQAKMKNLDCYRPKDVGSEMVLNTSNNNSDDDIHRSITSPLLRKAEKQKQMQLYSQEKRMKDRKYKYKHLKYVCFNATEFQYGGSFRFQNFGDRGNLYLDKAIGNGGLNTNPINVLMDEMKLGDVVASSSCFPIGFEPLIFPNDYFDPKNQHKCGERRPNQIQKQIQSFRNIQAVFKNGIGIMDGGITDNQGIGSLCATNDHIKLKGCQQNEAISLTIVCDVGNNISDAWKPSKKKLDEQSLIKTAVTVKKAIFNQLLLVVYFLVIVLGLALVIIGKLYFIHQESPALYILGGAVIGLGLAPLIILGLIAYSLKNMIYFFLRDNIKKILKEGKRQAIEKEMDDLQNLDARLSQRMITERITSSLSTITTVFFKQIRRLNYSFLYSGSAFKGRRISAMIYKLNGVQDKFSKEESLNQKIMKPNQRLQSVSLTASRCPTALWWEDDDIQKNRFDALIACGQFTICYELLNYLHKLEDQQAEREVKYGVKAKDYDIRKSVEDYHKLTKALEDDWQKFNKDPFYLVRLPRPNQQVPN